MIVKFVIFRGKREDVTLPSCTCNPNTSPRSVQNVERRANSANVVGCGFRCGHDTPADNAGGLCSRTPAGVTPTH